MAQQENITYPPGVRDLTEEISTDDLVRRLKECAQAFQNMSQDEDNSAYIPLALLLASETFLEHRSQDVRLLAACCIADVFRVYAPEAPYKDVAQLKVIFEFFVEQLKGLREPQHPSFKRYFYLLENLSCVKTFNICFEFEDNQNIVFRLFRLMFKIISDNHSIKVRKFMLDMLSPLITESDLVPQELIDIILSQTIEPVKSQNKIACVLAQEILKRTATTLEPYIQAYFNNALLLERPEGDVTKHLYDLIYELNLITPSMMVMVLPQLECKLKSSDEKERLLVTRVVARMFTDKQSNMINQNKSLWSSFLQRFHDITPQVRLLCVQFSKHFLLNHPESKEDITEQLKQRSRDLDDDVRYAVVMSIMTAAKEDFDCINKDLLMSIKERTLDKKFRVRKEALLGLARLYKLRAGTIESLTSSDLESISWIKNKILHAYYQSLEDRLLVERILHLCLVPFQLPVEERMKMLYHLFCSVDENAVKAFKEILRCQKILRTQMRNILEIIQRDKSGNRPKSIANKVSVLCKNLPDPVKSKPFISKFCSDLEANIKLRSMMSVILNGNITCAEAENKVKDILKCLGNPIQSNSYYMTIKLLLERIAPVLIDKSCIKYLVLFVKDSLIDSCAIEAELGLQNSTQKGLELLLVLSYTFSHTFHAEEIYSNLMLFLQADDAFAADTTLQILINVVSELEVNFPEVCMQLLPLLENFVETGSSKQAKHAVYCINNIVSDKQQVFGNIINKLKNHFTLSSQYFRTALVSVGHIAFLCHDMFAADFKTIVSTKIVKELLMLDQEIPRGGEEEWAPLDALSDETKCKMEGMKVMVRWLAGLKDMVQPALSTLSLLKTVILSDGDLMHGERMSPKEKSWMRLSAASCMLKLCQEPKYAAAMTLDTFQILANTMNDSCSEVCDRFAKKINKGLFFLKLPLEFLAVFCLAGFSSRKMFQDQVKNYLKGNINKRREYLKDRAVSNDELPMYFPDYSVSYAVYLLAHSKNFNTYNDIDALRKIKECLKLLLDALMAKNENYSFPFFKRLLENIKQTKDRLSLPEPGDKEEEKKEKEEMNFKMYAVCDLALNIVLSKPNHVLKEFPAEPTLNSRFFTDADKTYSNMKTYLPPELLNPLKVGFEVEMFDSTKHATSTLLEKSTLNTTKDDAIPSTSHAEPVTSSSEKIQPSVLHKKTSPSVSRKESSPSTSDNLQTDFVGSESNTSSPEISSTVTQESINSGAVKQQGSSRESETIAHNSMLNSESETPNCASENSELDLNHNDSSNSESISKDSGVSSSKDTSSVKNSVMKRPRGRPPLKNKLETSTRSTRSSRTPSISTPSSLHLSNVLSTSKQNGTLSSSPSEVSNISSRTSEFQHLIKPCNVFLRKDEVENYTANSLINSNEGSKDSSKTKRSTNVSTDNLSSGNSSGSQTDKDPPRRNARFIRNLQQSGQSSTVLSKRKRDASPPLRSVRNRTDSSPKNTKIASATRSSVKSPIKNGRASRETKPLQKVKTVSNHSASPKNSIKKESKDSITRHRLNNLRQTVTKTEKNKQSNVRQSKTSKRR